MFAVLASSVALLALLLSAVNDLRTSEIPEILSAGLVAFILALAAFNSLIDGEVKHVVDSISYGALMLLIGYALFILGQWGGGDVKILVGVGCLIGYLGSLEYAWPVSTFMSHQIPAALTYFINMAVLSTPYVVLYTLVLGFTHPRIFNKFTERLLERRVIAVFLLSLVPLATAYYLGFEVLSLIYALVPLLLVASIYMKTVEDLVLKKKIPVSKLKEWDIVADDVVYDGVKIASKRNIEGITKEQLDRIRELSGKGRLPDEIEIKWGIKFAPILFLSLLSTLYVGNLLELVFWQLFKIH